MLGHTRKQNWLLKCIDGNESDRMIVTAARDLITEDVKNVTTQKHLSSSVAEMIRNGRKQSWLYIVQSADDYNEMLNFDMR